MPKKNKNSNALALGASARLNKLQHLLFRNPRGLSARELSNILGATPRQIQRDIKTLSDDGEVPIYVTNEGETVPRYAIIPGYFLPPVHFNWNEATALYVAARLLARYSDEHNPLVVQALAKLASAMPEAIATHVHNTIRSLAYKPKNAKYARVFEIITRGWAEHKKVKIWHQAADSENVHEYVLAPYFVEPSSLGYSLYVIGHSTYFDDIHTFKVERIQHAELLKESFALPDTFDGTELLKDAWGVMYGKEIVKVRLRFAASATRRIKESIWHPSQKVEFCPDGGCIVTFHINHTLEMENWIRGWGSQVEVLVPAELRAKMAEEARKMAGVYAGDVSS